MMISVGGLLGTLWVGRRDLRGLAHLEAQTILSAVDC